MNFIFYSVVFGVLFHFNLLTESFPLWCRFYPQNEYGYTCIGMEIEIFSKDNRTVTSVRGAPLSGRNVSDVTYFSIFSRAIYYFPRGIENVFKNVINIQISDAQLLEVVQDDLKPFGNNLKMLWMFKNNLSTLEANLFEFNQNLESLNVSQNYFKTIDAKLFDNLPVLRLFDLSNNFCNISDGLPIAFNRTDVIKVIESIKINCQASD